LIQRELEELLNNEICKMYKRWVGKGPKYIKTRIFEDIIVVRFEKYDEPLFTKLSETKMGRELMKSMSERIFKLSKNELIKVVESIIECNVKKVYLDAQNIDGEMALTITCKKNIPLED